MKNLVLIVLFALSSCSAGKNQESSTKTPGGRPAPDLSRSFNDTTRVDQAMLLDLLSATVQAGQALNSVWAERCWLREQARPQVAEGCLLAWSIAPQKSELLEKEITRLALSNHTVAVAAVRSETPLARLAEGEFHQLLKALAEDPVWLRAKAILAWRQTHNAPGIVENEAWNVLLAAEQAAVPADFRFAYLAAQSLDPTKASLQLSRHCNALVADELITDCWRFASSFLGGTGNDALPDELRPWISNTDRAWAMFRLNWPERARLLERQLGR